MDKYISIHFNFKEKLRFQEDFEYNSAQSSLAQTLSAQKEEHASLQLTRDQIQPVFIDVEQRSDSWFDLRKDKFTASKFGEIVKKKNINNLLLDLNKKFKNQATEHGIFFEDLAYTIYQKLITDQRYSLEKTGFVLIPQIPWIGGSPDGVVYDNFQQLKKPIACLEIKCPVSLKSIHAQSLKDAYFLVHFKDQEGQQDLSMDFQENLIYEHLMNDMPYKDQLSFQQQLESLLDVAEGLGVNESENIEIEDQRFSQQEGKEEEEESKAYPHPFAWCRHQHDKIKRHFISNLDKFDKFVYKTTKPQIKFKRLKRNYTSQYDLQTSFILPISSTFKSNCFFNKGLLMKTRLDYLDRLMSPEYEMFQHFWQEREIQTFSSPESKKLSAFVQVLYQKQLITQNTFEYFINASLKQPMDRFKEFIQSFQSSSSSLNSLDSENPSNSSMMEMEYCQTTTRQQQYANFNRQWPDDNTNQRTNSKKRTTDCIFNQTTGLLDLHIGQLQKSHLFLDINHNYYYQCQGQMFITNTDICDFLVFTYDQLLLIRIRRDQAFIEKMISKLQCIHSQIFSIISETNKTTKETDNKLDQRIALPTLCRNHGD